MNAQSLYQPVSGLAMREPLDGASREREAVVLASLARIAEVDGELLAMTAVTPRDEAIAAARSAHGPLAGLTVAVKDIFDTAGLVTSYGSPIYAGHRPAADAAIVTMLRRAGAVVIGKASTCEFAYMSPSVTRNPWDLARTPGGSSAGSAAAVAAGMVPFAIGSQTGGSTIRPASFCGIASYKPTFGMLPTVGMKCFSWSFDTVGLFAAGVRDVAFLGEVLTGHDFSATRGQKQSQTQSQTDKPVFAVPVDYPWDAPSDNARAALDTAVRAIEEAGGRVQSVRFEPWMHELLDAHHVIQSYEAWRTLGYEYDHHRESLSGMLRDFLECAGPIGTDAYAKACALVRQAKGQQHALFEGVTALLTPGAIDEAPVGYGTTGSSVFNRNWTLLGNPCVSVPGLQGSSGAPVGVQVIGMPWDDARCLHAAAFVEQAIAASLRVRS